MFDQSELAVARVYRCTRGSCTHSTFLSTGVRVHWLYHDSNRGFARIWLLPPRFETSFFSLLAVRYSHSIVDSPWISLKEPKTYFGEFQALVANSADPMRGLP